MGIMAQAEEQLESAMRQAQDELEIMRQRREIERLEKWILAHRERQLRLQGKDQEYRCQWVVEEFRSSAETTVEKIKVKVNVFDGRDGKTVIQEGLPIGLKQLWDWNHSEE